MRSGLLEAYGGGLLANGFPNCTVAMAKLNGFPVPDVLSGLVWAEQAAGCRNCAA